MLKNQKIFGTLKNLRIFGLPEIINFRACRKCSTFSSTIKLISHKNYKKVIKMGYGESEGRWAHPLWEYLYDSKKGDFLLVVQRNSSGSVVCAHVGQLDLILADDTLLLNNAVPVTFKADPSKKGCVNVQYPETVSKGHNLAVDHVHPSDIYRVVSKRPATPTPQAA